MHAYMYASRIYQIQKYRYVMSLMFLANIAWVIVRPVSTVEYMSVASLFYCRQLV